MSSLPPGPSELARVLAQRRTLGAPPFILPQLDRSEALALAAAARRSGAGPRPVDSGQDGLGTPPVTTPAPRSSEEGVDYPTLRVLAAECTRCGLAEGRTQVVVSDGAPDARLMVIGEAPGAHEDRTGLPFVGPAGKLLDLLLASVDLSRERSVHICNVLKCRPPGNRNPRPDEIEACTPFLRRQIELVQPEVILGVGSFAAGFLTGSEEPLGRLRGEVYEYQGTPVVVTYHPAALLRNPGWIRPTWDDLQLLRRILDAGGEREGA